MKREKVFIFLAILFCFVLVNIAVQAQMNNGYMARKDNENNPDMIIDLGRCDYTVAVRMFPVAISVVLLLIVYLGMEGKDDPNRKEVAEQ